ncbi:DUF72 domain-containing protein [Coralloluteibacterium stylophorae]|uniref:DUF72 domain-containing protein n=1 Tax=Coralloluteibacterium stylophorae TaxID=1776034 RepID=A0A8J7VWA9_9GAMM|nr:DUF72 domain-containing protein [Coralloluteibacterium stylophorae]MBS7456504.1 DUF72 domain-containing protein [Coralloluteibacterium stylophorae]
MPADLFTPDAARDDAVAAPHGIRVGIGGWVFAPWRDNFYPRGLVQRRELEYASRHLSAIEINGTYHGPQKPATFARWAAEVPAGFVFAAKAPKWIVTSPRWRAQTAAARRFLEGGLEELGEHLGPVLWQAPLGHRFDRDDLAAFLDALPRTLAGRPLRHVVEVRDPSFLCADYLALARTHGVATVITDAPDYPNLADLTAGFAYLRLMRSRAGEACGYPAPELDAWAARARAWAGGAAPDDLPRVAPPDDPPAAAREVFVFFIGAAKARNPAAAMALIERL